MKISIIAFSILLSGMAYGRTLDTTCIEQDCFANGWVTIGINDSFQLEAKCKSKDCRQLGWKSFDSDGSLYDVACKVGGCYTVGWHSVQTLDDYQLKDEVTCAKNNCLKFGPVIKNQYDRGGKVACLERDCSVNGGTMYWRQQLWITKCKQSDCYKYRWTSDIY